MARMRGTASCWLVPRRLLRLAPGRPARQDSAVRLGWANLGVNKNLADLALCTRYVLAFK
jgi:hypothetical protein